MNIGKMNMKKEVIGKEEDNLFDIDFDLTYSAYYGFGVGELYPDIRILRLDLAAEHDLTIFTRMIEHESVHQILYDLIDLETCEAYDNIDGMICWVSRGKEKTFLEW